MPQIERTLTDQLWNLTESFGKAARDDPATTTENTSDLAEDLERATVIRDELCHGSRRPPGETGASAPLFINRKKEKFDTPIDLAYLKQVQAYVLDLICSVIDTATHMGWQFPDGAGPGKPIMSKSSWRKPNLSRAVAASHCRPQ